MSPPDVAALSGSQVLHQGSQVSACALVKGTQRNLFVVPTSHTFEDQDLKTLQEEADADPSVKGQLMKNLHVSCISTTAQQMSVCATPRLSFVMLTVRCLYRLPCATLSRLQC